MPNVIDLVWAGLRARGYDGLFSDECGCSVDDLAPCGEIQFDCEAGYRHEGCSTGCGEGCDFHIKPDKPVSRREGTR